MVCDPMTLECLQWTHRNSMKSMYGPVAKSRWPSPPTIVTYGSMNPNIESLPNTTEKQSKTTQI